MKLQLTPGSWIINIIAEYMATIVCALPLAAKRALFSCIDQPLLARCRRHIQSVFNLIVDILMKNPCYGQLIDSCQKGYPLTSVTWLYGGLKCTTHWGYVFFLSYPLISYWFNWSQAQVHKEKTVIINNLTWSPFGHYAIARSIHLG